MREPQLRALVARLVAREGPRLTVPSRRLVLAIADAEDHSVWVCEACGDTNADGAARLAACLIERHTRRREGSVTILCAACRRRRVPRARVVSDD